jgi:hypothetical protein
MYTSLPALLSFFKCIPEVVFCEGDSSSIISIVKMMAFKFNLQSDKQRKVGWLRDDSHVAFGKKNSLVKNEV